MDIGITENEFWQLSLAEVCRRFDSSRRIKKEQAISNYCFANMIAFSMSRLYKNREFPPVEKFYPYLFDDEETREQEERNREQKAIAYFKGFAAEHNLRFQEANNE